MKNRNCAHKILAAAGVVWLCGAHAQAVSVVHCDRDRYYEGESVTCDVPQDPGVGQAVDRVTVRWSILGKDLEKKDIQIPWPVKTKPAFSIQAPVGLRSVAPLELEATYRHRSHSAPVAIFRMVAQLFPRDPAFWIGKDEFKGKTIMVDPLAAWVQPHLDALHIPYMVNDGRELQALKRVDVLLSDKMLSTVNPADPWARWQLVQALRTQINAAARTSNL